MNKIRYIAAVLIIAVTAQCMGQANFDTVSVRGSSYASSQNSLRSSSPASDTAAGSRASLHTSDTTGLRSSDTTSLRSSDTTGLHAASDTAAADTVKAPRNYCPSGISVWGAGGMSILNYNTSFGTRNNAFGGAFGVGYSYYWSEHWGFLIGVELAWYRSKFNMNDFKDNYNTLDLDVYQNPENINFRYRIDDYEERQSLMNLNVPLIFNYQTSLYGRHRFFAGLGFKLGIPLKAEYKSAGFNITSAGYYYDETGSHQVLHDVTELGFGEFSNKALTNRIKLGLSYIGTLEAGIKWEIGRYRSTELHLGLYFDYAFNDVVKRGMRNRHIIDYGSFNGKNYDNVNSILVSKHAHIDDVYAASLPKGESKNMTGRVSPLAVGLKLNIRIGFCERKREVEKTDDCGCGCGDCNDCCPKTVTVRDTVKITDTVIVRVDSIIVKRDTVEKTVQVAVIDTPATLEDFKVEVADSNKMKITLRSIYYSLGKFDLLPSSYPELNKLAYYLLEHLECMVEIGSHTDSRGSDALNSELSYKRAQSVIDYLILRGINRNRMVAKGYGETQLLNRCSNGVKCSETEHAINRRTEFLLFNCYTDEDKESNTSVNADVETYKEIEETNTKVEYIIVGVFKRKSSADSELKKLQKMGEQGVVLEDAGKFKVGVPCNSLNKEEVMSRLKLVYDEMWTLDE